MKKTPQDIVVPEEFPRIKARAPQYLGLIVLRLLGWTIDGEVPAIRKGVLIVAPHTSNWDFVIGLAAILALRLKVRWLGKHTIFVGPFGWLWRQWGGQPVERSSASEMVQQTVTFFETHDQFVLALAPEGTRKHVERWKSGFYHIAHQAGVTITPVALNFESKTIVICPAFKPTGDAETEIQQLRDMLSQFPAKNPELV